MTEAVVAGRSRLAGAIDAALDGVVVAFAVWTVTFHLALVVGLRRDVTAGLWVAVLIALAALAPRRQEPRSGAVATTDEQPVTIARSFAVPLALAAHAIGIAVGAVVLDGGWWWLVWSVVAVISATATFLVLRARRRRDERDERSRSFSVVAGVAVLVVAVAFAVLSAITQRPDADDVFLLDKATEVEHDSGEFSTRDTIFADEVFRSTRPENAPETSFEPLIGVLARYSPLSAPDVAYLVLGPLAAFLGILALWRLLRSLFAPAPTLAALLAAGFLLLDGREHASFGNMNFARAWQGKVVFLIVVVPLLWHYALEWARRGDRRSLAGLVAGNVAAIGLTSTAAFVAPAVTLIGVVAGNRAVRRLAGGALAAAYPLLVTLITVAQARGPGYLGPPTPRVTEPAEALTGQIGGGPESVEAAAQWYFVTGRGVGAFVITAAVLVAWQLVRDRPARLALALAPLGLFLVFLTPGAPELIDAYTSSDSILWRALWIVPIPAMVGLTLTGPFAYCRRAWQWPAVGALALGIATLLLVYENPVIDTENRNLRVGGLAWDVDGDDRDAADRLAALSPEGGVVAAPEAISGVLAIAHHDVFPVNPRTASLFGAHAVDRFRANTRLFVTRLVETGGLAEEAEEFTRALDDLGVSVVCTRARLEGSAAGQGLGAAGFQIIDRDDQCTYWQRS